MSKPQNNFYREFVDQGITNTNTNADTNDIEIGEIRTTKALKKQMNDYNSNNNNNNNNNNNTLRLAVPPSPKRTWRRVLEVLFKINPKINTRDIRVIPLGLTNDNTGNANQSKWDSRGFSPNAMSHNRYSLLTFLPLSLIKQFSSFFNFFYLLLSLSQLIPELKVGFIVTYFSPLALVVTLSLIKEATEEIQCYYRDKRANEQEYIRLVTANDISGSNSRGTFSHRNLGSCVKVKAKDIRVGDYLLLRKDERVPADCVILSINSSNNNHNSSSGDASSNTCFIRTDQLDGETDWKLRFPLRSTQVLSNTSDGDNANNGYGYSKLVSFRANVECEPLHKDIYKFSGALEYIDYSNTSSDLSGGRAATIRREPISLDNMLWSSCVVASGDNSSGDDGTNRGNSGISSSGGVVALCVHTGSDTRAAMNTSPPHHKVGLIERELNYFGMVCFGFLILFSLLLVIDTGFSGDWVLNGFRYFILLSAIIPISMRVNVDVARMLYGRWINRDSYMPGASARNTELTEELGRLSFLFSDKTGTLTKNIMHFKVLQLGPELVVSERDSDRLAHGLRYYYRKYIDYRQPQQSVLNERGSSKEAELIGEMLIAMVLCHNVSPVRTFDSHSSIRRGRRRNTSNGNEGGEEEENMVMEYQASSPDEIALVKFCQSLGLQLEKRTSKSISFRYNDNGSGSGGRTSSEKGPLITYEIVKMFPFSSERKCMGIIMAMDVVNNTSCDRVYKFFMKGADTHMSKVINSRSENSNNNNNNNSGGASMGLGLRAGGRMNNNNTDNNEWLNEGCQELAKAGLRTLVFASRVLTEQFVTEFLQQYEEACAIVGSEEAVGPGTANADPANAGSSDGYKARRLEAVLGTLETDMKLIGITGVEDELQDDVVFSIETLSMCGLKIWVLTGDKIETATTIARATRLIPRNGTVETLLCLNSEEAWARLRQLQAHHDHITTDAFLSGYTGNDSSGRGGGGGGGDGLAPSFQPLPPSSTSHLLDYVNDASLSTPWTLILDGFTLDLCLTPGLRGLFVAVAQAAHAVVIARCSPTQKAMVVRLMKDYSDTVEKGKLRTAAIGDGGNDVSMILEAHVGIGLEGKEGRQASMAADFSLTKFAHLTRLVTWHGRNSYHRTCLLSQFIMHRGMIYSVMQAFYCALLSGAPKALFNGYLLMGYSTLFTMAPAFALILDEDAREEEVREYPFLYRTLVKSRAMNLRSFLEWVWVSIFQGGILTFATFFIFDEGTERAYAASIAYGALLVTEFVMVGAGVHLRVLWHQRRLHFFLFFLAEAVSILFFVIAVFVLPDTFDAEFLTAESLGRVLLLGLLSVVPVMLLTVLARGVLFNPRVVAKCCR